MGTANKQIATRANVNSKRLGAFVTASSGGTYMKKCATKKAVTDIEYLQVNNRETTTAVDPTGKNYTFGGATPQVSMSIRQSSTYNTTLSSSNIVVDTYSHDIWCLMQANVYASSTYVSLNYSANWPTIANAKYYALYKRTLTVPTNQLLTLSLQCSIMGAISDSASSFARANKFYASSVTWYPSVIITNSDDSYCIASISPYHTSNNSYSNSIAFKSTYSTINVYFLISNISMTFNPSYEEYYAGFVVNCTMNLKYNDSYYDQTYKCVQYQDIAMKGGTFPCQYYIWNNKSSNAKLDFVKARISLTSTIGQGTWTDVGSVDPGTVSGTKSGTITCTLPASIDLSKQYYFYVECGYTNNNQQWYGGWGSGGANNNASTHCGKQTWGYTPVVPFNSATGSTQNVLNYTTISSWAGASMGTMYEGISGRTSTRAALFRIE